MVMKRLRKTDYFYTNKQSNSREFYNIPLVGEVHIEAEPGSGGNYNLGELIKNIRSNAGQSITVRAVDNGLASEGILHGDFLTINLSAKIRNGDIIAVKLGSKIFIRKKFSHKKFIRLESTAGAISPLIIDPKTPDFEVLGKVATVIREL